MEWTEEKYVKLYVRDSVTWLSWPWQARALWPVLMRKLDGAGLLECGKTEPAQAISLVVFLPLEVVEVGLRALLECGTLERVQNGVLAPKFLDGQEARKSDALRARESRARRRDEQQTRNHSESGGPASHAVTPRHTPSHAVTLQPSPAQPSPELLAGKPAKVTQPKPPPDPRHAPLVKALADAFGTLRGAKYGFSPRDAKAISNLLARHEPPAIEARWRQALGLTHPPVSNIHELNGPAWNRAAGNPATPAKGAAWQQPGATGWDNHPTSFLEGLTKGDK